MKRNKRKYIKRRGFNFIKIFFVLIFLGFLAIGYIWQRVTALKLTQDIKRIKSEIAEKEKKCKYLKIELAKLSSIERIESIAQLRLGLSYPKTEQVVFLKESNFIKTKKKENKIDLVQHFKKLADNFLDVPQSSLEAKEIKDDL